MKFYMVKLQVNYKEVYEKIFEDPIEARVFFINEWAKISHLNNTEAEQAILLNLKFEEFTTPASTMFFIKDSRVKKNKFDGGLSDIKSDYILIHKKYHKYRKRKKTFEWIDKMTAERERA